MIRSKPPVKNINHVEDQERAKFGFRSLHIFLIVILVGTLMLGPVTVLRLIVPSAPYRTLLAIIIFVSAEAALTTSWLSNTERKTKPRFYRAAELVTLILIMRFASWISNGSLPSLNSLPHYFLQPLAFLDLTFVGFVFATLLAWERGTSLSTIFINLALNEDEITYYSTATADRFKLGIAPVVPKYRSFLLQDYVREWLIGGLVLIFFAVLTTFDLPGAQQAIAGNIPIRHIGRLGLSPEILLALIVYFVFGLWLTSIGRMHVLQARWLTGGLESDTKLSQKWLRRTILMLMLIALIAAFLPIGSTAAISRILMAIAGLLILFAGAIVSLLAYVYFLILSLFGDIEPRPQTSRFDFTEFLPPSPPQQPSSDLIGLIFGIIFWLIIVVATGIALITFFRGRGIYIYPNWFSDIWYKFTTWFRQLWQLAIKFEGFPGLSKQNRPAATTKALESTRQWPQFRLTAMSPAEQIRYLYLSMVKHAAKSGISRQPNETPSEFATNLEKVWPDTQYEILLLTESFEVARYSKRSFTSPQLPPLRTAYKRLRAAFRKHRPKDVDSGDSISMN